ncbi:MAG: FAD-dependent oxidoreductase [Firmicutes bacterium]|nr:FAD-dependent oxidoreductase [Alicyclobacillaceae bacterium]MCL6496252.1 FAD-dependent oxidoreductase [Bacillota bacterium]
MNAHPLRVVVLGSRFGGLAVLVWLRRRLGSGVAVTVVEQFAEMVFRPGLVVAGAGDADAVARWRFPLAAVWRRLGVAGIHDTAVAIDPERRRVELASHPPLTYDVLFLATGVDAAWEHISGLGPDRGGVCEMPLAYRSAWRLRAWSGGTLVFAAGPLVTDDAGTPRAGCECPLVETALLCDAAFRRRGVRRRTRMVVVTAARALGEEGGPQGQAALLRRLRECAIEVVAGARFLRVTGRRLELEGGVVLPTDAQIWTPPYAGSALARRSGLADGAGFVPVTEFGRHRRWEDVYAVGDVAAQPGPKSAHAAMVQARVAVGHLAARLGRGRLPDPYRPLTLWAMETGFGQGLWVVSDVFWGGRRQWVAEGRWPWLVKQGFNRAYRRWQGCLPVMP